MHKVQINRMSKAKVLVFNLIFFFFMVVVDQISKYLIRHWGGFYLCNPGIAWGMKLPVLLFWFFWFLIVFFVIYLIYKEIFRKKSFNVFFLCALFLLLAGTIGNLIDRIIYGCVVDFINLKIWPVFNLADTFIVLGAIIILFKYPKRNQCV